MSWDDYYNKMQGRKPRQLLVKALDEYIRAGRDAHHLAADIGCGSGIETAFLLDRGWRVLAIDKEASAIRRLKANICIQTALETQVAAFEVMTLPENAIHLVYAGYSLPFCHPDTFASVWKDITRSIADSGYFVGEFFGERDSWATNPEWTFHTAIETRLLFDGFDIQFFHERETDGEAVSGPKHWHVYSVIAKKQNKTIAPN